MYEFRTLHKNTKIPNATYVVEKLKIIADRNPSTEIKEEILKELHGKGIEAYRIN